MTRTQRSQGLAIHALGVTAKAGTQPGKRLLHPCDLVVRPGVCAVIQGPSGAGKSTLLSAISGLIEPGLAVSGTVMAGGHAVQGLPAERRGIGLLFQRPILFPHLSVGQNIALGLAKRSAQSQLHSPSQSQFHSQSQQSRQQRVEHLLSQVALDGFLHRDPASLSGGQIARVALARALGAQPVAMLLDEPFSALDPDLRQTIRTLTFRMLAVANVPCVLVTHDDADVPSQHLVPELYQLRDGVLSQTASNSFPR